MKYNLDLVRYIIDADTIQDVTDTLHTVQYHKDLDEAVTIESEFVYSIIKSFLKDHYGEVIVYKDELPVLRLSNIGNMFAEFAKDGYRIILNQDEEV